MISERTLKKWRREAIQERETTIHSGQAEQHPHWLELQERIICLTRELMDAYLVRR